MTQETSIAAVTGLLQVLSGWKAWGVVVAIILEPWVMHPPTQNRLTNRINDLVAQITASDAENKARFDKAVRQYEDNVVLDQGYEQLSETLAQTIKRNTEAITRLNDQIDNNHFCPASRIKEHEKCVVTATK